MTDERRDPDRQMSRLGGRRATDKIACPRCGCLQSTVTNTWPGESTAVWNRRRECGGCGYGFGTTETYRDDPPAA